MTKKPISALRKNVSLDSEERPQAPKYAAGRRIPHKEILRALQNPDLGMTSIAEIYRTRVLSVSTRNLHLLGQKTPARIIETLLGYEVKASFKRIHCPDLITARYVKLFTELGCRTIRLPYDPTITAELMPDLERALTGIEKGVHELFPGNHNLQRYVLRRVFQHLRVQLRNAARITLAEPATAEVGGMISE